MDNLDLNCTISMIFYSTKTNCKEKKDKSKAFQLILLFDFLGKGRTTVKQETSCILLIYAFQLAFQEFKMPSRKCRIRNKFRFFFVNSLIFNKFGNRKI